MMIDLSSEALDFGRAARRAFEAAGGDELVRSAESDLAQRDRRAGAVLTELGAWELRPRADADEAEAAAALCRSAGYWAVPYPVAERLARSSDLDAVGLVVLGPGLPRGPVAGLAGEWAAVGLDGPLPRADPSVHLHPPHTSRSWRTSTSSRSTSCGTDELAMGLCLACSAGRCSACSTALLDLTRAFTWSVRRQFGQPLVQFQNVRFQPSDAEVERSGSGTCSPSTRSRACRPADGRRSTTRWRYAWPRSRRLRRCCRPHTSARRVRVCDEASLSWAPRSSMPSRQFPLGLSATRALLVERLGHTG